MSKYKAKSVESSEPTPILDVLLPDLMIENKWLMEIDPIRIKIHVRVTRALLSLKVRIERQRLTRQDIEAALRSIPEGEEPDVNTLRNQFLGYLAINFPGAFIKTTGRNPFV